MLHHSSTHHSSTQKAVRCARRSQLVQHRRQPFNGSKLFINPKNGSTRIVHWKNIKLQLFSQSSHLLESFWMILPINRRRMGNRGAFLQSTRAMVVWCRTGNDGKNDCRRKGPWGRGLKRKSACKVELHCRPSCDTQEIIMSLQN